MEFRSFELNPNAPAQQEGNLEEALARKYGVSLEQARAMNARVVDAAAGEGLHYRYDIAKRANTFDAHRLIHLAADEGRADEMKERLLRAYFTEGRAISDPTTLTALAVEVGLDRGRVADVLEGDDYGADVRADEERAMELGSTGVPFFVFDERLGVPGAQPPDVLLRLLERAWDTSAEAAAGTA